MSESTTERLYDLLPGVYKARDEAQGAPLRTLLAVMDRERQRLEDDIAGLYDDQFIETCAPWVIPYIADLLDLDIPPAVAEPRGFVGNAMRYRRRKGTPGVIEELAEDVSGWDAVVVEFFQVLASNQHVNHPRPERSGYVDMRNAGELEHLRDVRLRNDGGSTAGSEWWPAGSSPFAEAPRTAEVRRADTGRGKYGVANIGLFLWPLESGMLRRVEPAGPGRDGGDLQLAGVPSAPGGASELVVAQYTFDPTGMAAALFNDPAAHGRRVRPSENDVSSRLRRRAVYRTWLDAWTTGRSAVAQPGDDPLGFSIREGGSDDPVTVERLRICNLEAEGDADFWHDSPYDSSDYGRLEFLYDWEPADAVSHGGDPIYCVDPEAGRILALAKVEPGEPVTEAIPEITVDYATAELMPLGAGPDDRAESLSHWMDRRPDWQRGARRESAKTVQFDELSRDLTEAVDQWNALVSSTDRAEPLFGVIAITDSRTYSELVSVRVPPGTRLAIVAADWNTVRDEDGVERLRPGYLDPKEVRPHLRSGIEVVGGGGYETGEAGELILDGLLVEEGLEIQPGAVAQMTAANCTFVPGDGAASIRLQPGGTSTYVEMTIDRCICGGVALSGLAGELTIANSVIGAGKASSDEWSARGLDAPEMSAELVGATVFGATEVEQLHADDTVFADHVDVHRRQSGCVRFSCAPEASRLPRRYRCHLYEPEAEGTDGPTFVTRDWWRPNLARLQPSVPEAIAAGAEDGLEMGVYNELEWPKRLASLRQVFEDQIRVGMEGGIYFVT